jgi:L-ascorbate metabolism protein UlaG (beta-lactamase superfamily)
LKSPKRNPPWVPFSTVSQLRQRSQVFQIFLSGIKAGRNILAAGQPPCGPAWIHPAKPLGESSFCLKLTEFQTIVCVMRYNISDQRLSTSALILALASSLWFAPARAAENKITGDTIATQDGDLIIHPINHATFVLSWKGKIIYVDPVGGGPRFAALPRPDLILVTDIHGDHLNADTLTAVSNDKTALVAPSAVAEKLPENLRKQATVLANGQTKALSGITIEAIPMYNLTQERLNNHTKGRGNGYVLTIGGKRIYISGDTEDIPEMRALKNIDVAFVCMNLPYTMTVDQAASAVREFQPKIAYPYHHRGSDVEKFKKLVGDDRGVEVRLREWYK